MLSLELFIHTWDGLPNLGGVGLGLPCLGTLSWDTLAFHNPSKPVAVIVSALDDTWQPESHHGFGFLPFAFERLV